MGLGKGKTEKGSGGKRGQSGKENRITHQEEKEEGRRRRRIQSKVMERAAKSDSEQTG